MKTLLIIFAFLCIIPFSSNAQDEIPTAKSLMDAGYAQAKAENKNVFLIFHASWCGWCRKMDAAINDASVKKLFDRNYVFVHLTVEESKDKRYLENAGAADIKTNYLGAGAGLPFWVILDKDGKKLGDCYVRKPGQSMDEGGENMGCPASEEEVAAFVQTLKLTSKLDEKDLEKIAKRFSKNKPIGR